MPRSSLGSKLNRILTKILNDTKYIYFKRLEGFPTQTRSINIIQITKFFMYFFLDVIGFDYNEK